MSAWISPAIILYLKSSSLSMLEQSSDCLAVFYGEHPCGLWIYTPTFSFLFSPVCSFGSGFTVRLAIKRSHVIVRFSQSNVLHFRMDLYAMPAMRG